MTVELAAWVQGTRSALRRPPQSCRAYTCRARGEDRQDRPQRRWWKLVELHLRLNFKWYKFGWKESTYSRVPYA